MDAQARERLLKSTQELAKKGEHAAAAQAIIDGLNLSLTRLKTLDRDQRRLALLATNYAAKAGFVDVAIQLYQALGEGRRAQEIAERFGSPLQKKPITDQRKRIDLAQHSDERRKSGSDHHVQAGQTFDAATRLLEGGEQEQALEMFLRVRKEDERYRLACKNVVRLAIDLKAFSYRTEHYLTGYIDAGPTSDDEVKVFYRLGKAYLADDLLENAKEIFNKIRQRHPSYRDLSTQLQLIEQTLKQQVEQAADRVLKDELAFRDKESDVLPALGALPELPSLDDLEPPPQSASVLSQRSVTGPTNTVGGHRAPNVAATGDPYPGAGARSPASGEVPLERSITGETKRGLAFSDPRAVPADRTEGRTHTGLGRSQSSAGTKATPSPQRPALELEPNQMISDRYRLVARIGEGGSAQVFKALDLQLDEHVALKILTQQNDDATSERFRREIKVSRKLTHRNIIRVHDIGDYAGHFFISMELLEGATLLEKINEGVPFTTGLRYLIQTCSGLSAAHEKNIVHRDIKPENLFITEDDTVKLMDFGLAKQQHVPGITIQGITAGTPAFMAPEQISDFKHVGPLTDLYSLGVLMYLMFTGEYPFDHEEVFPLLMMHMQKEPRHPRALNPDITEELESVILELLAKNPDDRIQGASQLTRRLRRVQQSYANELR